MKNLLTVTETAEALNIKTSTVRAWLAKRKLPRVNCGRAVRIPADAIAQFIERNTVPTLEDSGSHYIPGTRKPECEKVGQVVANKQPMLVLEKSQESILVPGNGDQSGTDVLEI
jgi:excisionase family DNA binding protein